MKGFIKWLEEEKGLARIFEDPKINGDNHNRQALYKFSLQSHLQSFIEEVESKLNIKLQGIKNKEGEFVFVRVTKELQKQLKAEYLKEHGDAQDNKRLAERLNAVKQAKADLLSFNKLSNDEFFGKQYDPIIYKAFDKVGMMAKLLRNKEDGGWIRESGKAAAELAFKAYYALNYDHLSEAEKKYCCTAIEEFKKFNASYIKPEYKKAFDENRSDTFIFHGGGMSGHSAYRVIKRELYSQDIERYYYTKVDGGEGYEILNQQLYGIYTTEIKPVYQKNNFGYYIELTPQEKQSLNNNPKRYAQYMQATIDYLIECELKIELYSNPTSNNSNVDPEDAAEWKRLNDIINKARGEFVACKSHTTSWQISGNCAVYSFMLLIGHFIGVNLAYDMMQEVKGYNHHSLLWQLNTLKKNLEDQLRGYGIKQRILNKEEIDGMHPLAYAIKNEIKIEGMHPLKWVEDYNKINPENRLDIYGEAPEVWAMAHYNRSLIQQIVDSELIEGQDPLKYAIENDIQVHNMHPLIWALEHNIHNEQKVEIEGQDPLIWGLRNQKSIKIEGMSFVRYLQVYGIERFSKLATLAEKQVLMAALIEEYDALLKKSPVNEVEVQHLEQFYNTLYDRANFADRFERINKRNNPITKLSDILNKYTSTELSAIIKDTNEVVEKSNIIPDDIIEKLPLKEAHKLWEVGNKLADTGVLQTVIESITLAIIRIGDVFRVQSKEESIKSATHFKELIAESKEESGPLQIR